MDVGVFVQENKRWLVGCALGGIVCFIAGAVIDSIYDTSGAQLSLKKAGAAAQLYDKEILDAARTENEQLAAERQRLRAELEFVPSPKYQLAAGDPGMFLFQVGHALKQSILAEANARDVAVAEKDVRWDVPTSPDEIRGVLLGLELMEEVSKRLFAAHDAVRAAKPDALGLRGIVALRLGARNVQRATGRPARTGEIDPRDRLTQEQLTFTFQSDEMVLQAFFEACRQPKRALVILQWKVERPTRAGEPCTVTGTIQGIAFKDDK